jgi:hydrogenase maturation protease
MARILVAGLGSPHGDDAIGWRVVDLLADHARMRYTAGDRPPATFRKFRTPIDLVSGLADIDQLHLVDAGAAEGDASPVTRIDYRSSEDRSRLQSLWSVGTHDLGCLEALRLAESLDVLPPSVTIWVARGSGFAPLTDLSPLASESIEQCVTSIRRRLADSGCPIE